MSISKAPWKIKMNWQIKDAEGMSVAEVLYRMDGTHDQNARIITAAPELLRALKEIQLKIENQHDNRRFSDTVGILRNLIDVDIWPVAEKAIAKAEGK